MKAVLQDDHDTQHYDYPTSPWTEVYQFAPFADQTSMAEGVADGFTEETQRPTHDALSEIYNRDYAVM